MDSAQRRVLERSVWRVLSAEPRRRRRRTRVDHRRLLPSRPKGIVMTSFDTDFSGLRALFINCTLKRSPEISTGIMEKHGIEVDVVRAVDHDIATGVWPDMRGHGCVTDDWPAIFDKVMAADILVLAGPI